MTETGKVFLRYLYKRFGWKVIHHRKKLFRIIHKRAFETSMKKLKFVIFTNAPCKGLNSNSCFIRHKTDIIDIKAEIRRHKICPRISGNTVIKLLLFTPFSATRFAGYYQRTVT